MCLVVLSWQPDQDQWLTLASNRDEFLQRPTKPLHEWHSKSINSASDNLICSADADILAGQDVRQGGSWLAFHRGGSFAALTNIRRLGVEHPRQISRGQLLVDAVAKITTCRDFVASLLQEIKAEDYAPFNLLVGNRKQLLYVTNYDLLADEYRLMSQQLTPGCYGLSNAHLDTSWPKLVAAKQLLGQWQRGTLDCELGYLLTSTQQADDHQLPNTGIPIEFERSLSAAFVRTEVQGEDYGTRSSAAIVANQQQVEFTEIQWQQSVELPQEQNRRHYRWQLPSS